MKSQFEHKDKFTVTGIFAISKVFWEIENKYYVSYPNFQ